MPKYYIYSVKDDKSYPIDTPERKAKSLEMLKDSANYQLRRVDDAHQAPKSDLPPIEEVTADTTIDQGLIKDTMGTMERAELEGKERSQAYQEAKQIGLTKLNEIAKIPQGTKKLNKIANIYRNVQDQPEIATQVLNMFDKMYPDKDLVKYLETGDLNKSDKSLLRTGAEALFTRQGVNRLVSGDGNALIEGLNPLDLVSRMAGYFTDEGDISDEDTMIFRDTLEENRKFYSDLIQTLETEDANAISKFLAKAGMAGSELGVRFLSDPLNWAGILKGVTGVFKGVKEVPSAIKTGAKDVKLMATSPTQKLLKDSQIDDFRKVKDELKKYSDQAKKLLTQSPVTTAKETFESAKEGYKTLKTKNLEGATRFTDMTEPEAKILSESTRWPFGGPNSELKENFARNARKATGGNVQNLAIGKESASGALAQNLTGGLYGQSSYRGVNLPNEVLSSQELSSFLKTADESGMAVADISPLMGKLVEDMGDRVGKLGAIKQFKVIAKESDELVQISKTGADEVAGLSDYIATLDATLDANKIEQLRLRAVEINEKVRRAEELLQIAESKSKDAKFLAEMKSDIRAESKVLKEDILKRKQEINDLKKEDFANRYQYGGPENKAKIQEEQLALTDKTLEKSKIDLENQNAVQDIAQEQKMTYEELKTRANKPSQEIARAKGELSKVQAEAKATKATLMKLSENFKNEAIGKMATELNEKISDISKMNLNELFRYHGSVNSDIRKLSSKGNKEKILDADLELFQEYANGVKNALFESVAEYTKKTGKTPMYKGKPVTFEELWNIRSTDLEKRGKLIESFGILPTDDLVEASQKVAKKLEQEYLRSGESVADVTTELGQITPTSTKALLDEIYGEPEFAKLVFEDLVKLNVNNKFRRAFEGKISRDDSGVKMSGLNDRKQISLGVMGGEQSYVTTPNKSWKRKLLDIVTVPLSKIALSAMFPLSKEVDKIGDSIINVGRLFSEDFAKNISRKDYVSWNLFSPKAVIMANNNPFNFMVHVLSEANKKTGGIMQYMPEIQSSLNEHEFKVLTAELKKRGVLKKEEFEQLNGKEYVDNLIIEGEKNYLKLLNKGKNTVNEAIGGELGNLIDEKVSQLTDPREKAILEKEFINQMSGSFTSRGMTDNAKKLTKMIDDNTIKPITAGSAIVISDIIESMGGTPTITSTIRDHVVDENGNSIKSAHPEGLGLDFRLLGGGTKAFPNLNLKKVNDGTYVAGDKATKDLIKEIEDKFNDKSKFPFIKKAIVEIKNPNTYKSEEWAPHIHFEIEDYSIFDRTADAKVVINTLLGQVNLNTTVGLDGKVEVKDFSLGGEQ